MLRKLDSITPPFLKNIDQYLLVNYPHIWATRIHYVLFGSAAYTALLYLISIIYPISANSLPDHFGHFAFSFIIPVAAAIFWIYNLYLFKEEKLYGSTNFAKQLISQVLILSGGLALCVAPYVYSSSLEYRISRVEKAETLLKDVDKLDIGYYYFIHITPALYFDENGNEKEGTATEAEIQDRITNFYTNNSHNYGNDLYYSQSNREKRHLFPTHTLVKAIKKNNGDLYEKYIKGANKATQLAQIQDFIEVNNKYSEYTITESPNEILAKRAKGENIDEVENYDVGRNIRTIWKAQQGEDNIFNIFVLMINGYVVILFSFLVFILLKTNFLTLIYTALYSIAGFFVNFFLVGVSRSYFREREEDSASILLLVSWSLLVAFAYGRRNTKRFTLLRQISLSIATAITPVLPFVYYAIDPQYDNDYARELIVIFIPFLGVLLLFFLWNFAFNKRLRDLQAQPTRN